MYTLANVTLICGSSSRGVTSTANKPNSNPTNANNGVISVVKKFFAIEPEIPNDGLLMSLFPRCLLLEENRCLHWVNRDLFTRTDSS